MAAKISYSSIEDGIGVRPSKHPKDNYQESAHVVWYFMRQAVPEDAAPITLAEALPGQDKGWTPEQGKRTGYLLEDLGIIQAVRKIWPGMTKAEDSTAANQIRKVFIARDAGYAVVPGRANTRSVWWIAEAPTDWGKTAEIDEPHRNNGKVVPELVLTEQVVPELVLTEQSVPNDSDDDRVAKGFDMVSEVLREQAERIRSLTTMNAILTAKLAKARETLAD